MQHIAERIQARRTDLGLSETQLATASGIARMTLKRRLVDPAAFTLDELERVATVLGTTAESLILAGEAA